VIKIKLYKKALIAVFCLLTSVLSLKIAQGNDVVAPEPNPHGPTTTKLIMPKGAEISQKHQELGIDSHAIARVALETLVAKIQNLDIVSLEQEPQIIIEDDMVDSTVAAMLSEFVLQLSDGRKLDLGMTAINARVSPDAEHLAGRIAFSNPIILRDAYDQERRLALRNQESRFIYKVNEQSLQMLLISFDMGDMDKDGVVQEPIKRITLSYPDHQGGIMLSVKDSRASSPTIMQPDMGLGVGVIMTRFINLF